MDFSSKGQVTIDMTKYVKDMIKDFPETIGKPAPTPAAEKLYMAHDSPPFEKKRKEHFHHFVARGLFVGKRARPDIQPVIAFLCTMVQSPTEEDWFKLVQMMSFLKGTQDDYLTSKANKLNIVKWYAHAAFAIHPDMKSHTGITMTMGKGAITSSSRKQKMNTRSSTEAELVGADDALTGVIWTKNFMESQGYKTNSTLNQGNKSMMQLEMNGKASSHKRTRHLNICFFTIKDYLDRKDFDIKHCPTDDMMADYMTKPFQGGLFTKNCKQVMGMTHWEIGN